MSGSDEVDAYIASLPESKQKWMSDIRAWARAAAPDATEVITYKMPGLKTGKKFLISYDAFKKHYSIFPGSEGVHKALGTDIEPFLTGKGTISFTEEKPLSEGQITSIVKARMAEIEAEGR